MDISNKLHGNSLNEWSPVVLAWVNSLVEGTATHYFENIFDLKDSVFLSDWIKEIYKYGNATVPVYENIVELAETFLKDYFPDCLRGNHLHLQDEDLILLLSLIIYASCVQFQIKDVLRKNCAYIKTEYQIKLKIFLENLVKHGDGKLKRHAVIDAINKSLGSPFLSSRSASPPSTSSCLKDFFDSPNIQDRKQKSIEINRLKSLLEEEINEKNELVEKVMCLEEKLRKTESELHQKIKENKILKDDLNQSIPIPPDSLQKRDDEQAYLKEIGELKRQIREAQSENETLIDQLDKYSDQKKELERKIKELGESLSKQSMQSQDDALKIVTLEKANNHLQTLNKELNQTIEQYKEEKRMSGVHNMSSSLIEENLGEVTDLVLKEKIEKLQDELLLSQGKCDTISADKETQIQSLLEENSLLKEETVVLKQKVLDQDPQLKEAYDKLLYDNHRLNDENEALTSENKVLAEAKINIRAEYELKLNLLKTNMKETCTKAMQQTEENCEKKVKQLQEVIKANQDHISQLSSQLWDTSDKLIVTKKENEDLRKTVSELKQSLNSQSGALLKQKSRSHLMLPTTPEIGLDIEQSYTVTRRQSIRTVPSGMGIKLLPSGKVFPSEDEGDEMFNNECLADLKAGRCQIPNEPDRVSILQYRNSLCPPHLKSSYPAETQFLPIDRIQEDDIKGKGGDGEDTKSLLSEKHRKKDRLQPSYKRPGPPTPSKNGGRGTSQTLEAKSEGRPILRELNEGQARKPGTPSRLFSQFFTRSKDENTPTTPNRRRLSIFKKQHFGK